MAMRHGGWLAGCVLALATLAPGPVRADGLLGWRHNPDCPPGWYSPLHYWAPSLYFIKDRIERPSVTSYPPGPCPPVEPTFLIQRYPCPTTAPAPTLPYADPAGYYGRPAAPEAPTGPRP